MILLSFLPAQRGVAKKEGEGIRGERQKLQYKITFLKTSAGYRIMPEANHLYVISLYLHFPTKTQKFPYKRQ